MPPRSSIPGLSAENIIEGGRKRARVDQDGGSAQNSPLLGAAPTLGRAGSASVMADNERDQITRTGYRILDYVINRPDDSDDSPMCIPFLALPLRSDYPDYYEQIKTPVSLEQIRRRLQARQYSNIDELRNAFETIWRNAKRYNQKGSDIYERARQLHTITRDAFVDLANGDTIVSLDGGPVESKPALFDQANKLAKIEKPKALARLDYDESDDGAPTVSLRLKRPDDLTYDEDDETLNQSSSDPGIKVESHDPDGDTEMAYVKGPLGRDPVTSVKIQAASPALASQTPDSDGEGEDAVELSDLPGYDSTTGLLNGKPLDKNMLTQNGKFDRRKRPGPRGKRLKSTLRHLINEMQSATTRNGELLCEWFLELPSKQQLPDYYKVVAKPISMREIEHKANHSLYVNPHAMVSDLRLMTANAKYYNQDGSPVWQAADEIDRYVSDHIIAPLLADGFTMNPDDMRQSALPMEYAAASPIAAHAAAFRRAQSSGGNAGALQSPEPSIVDAAAGANGAVAGPSHIPIHGMSTTPGASASLAPHSGSPGAVSWPGQGQQQQGAHLSPTSRQVPLATDPTQLGQAGAMSPAETRSQFGTMQPPASSSLNQPVQRPQIGTPSQAMPFATPVGQLPSSQITTAGTVRTPKRLLGDVPLDPYASVSLTLRDGKVWRRRPVTSFFVIRGPAMAISSPARDAGVVLTNELTRIHSICIGQVFRSASAELANGDHQHVTVEFRLGVLIRTTDVETDDDEAAAAQNKTWKVNVRHNGRHVPFSVRSGKEGALSTKKHDVFVDKTLSHKEALAKLNEGVDVAQGATCLVSLRLPPGVSAFDLTITPGPPDATLAALAKDETQEHNAVARALLQLPDRYRILLHRT